MKKIALFLIAFIPLIAQEIKIDAPKVISKEWEAKNLGIKYQCPDLDGAVEEFVEGIIDDTFNKAFLQRVRAEMEKNPSGEFVEYWPNGQENQNRGGGMNLNAGQTVIMCMKFMKLSSKKQRKNIHLSPGAQGLVCPMMFNKL